MSIVNQPVENAIRHCRITIPLAAITDRLQVGITDRLGSGMGDRLAAGIVIGLGQRGFADRAGCGACCHALLLLAEHPQGWPDSELKLQYAADFNRGPAFKQLSTCSPNSSNRRLIQLTRHLARCELFKLALRP